MATMATNSRAATKAAKSATKSARKSWQTRQWRARALGFTLPWMVNLQCNSSTYSKVLLLVAHRAAATTASFLHSLCRPYIFSHLAALTVVVCLIYMSVCLSGYAFVLARRFCRNGNRRRLTHCRPLWAYYRYWILCMNIGSLLKSCERARTLLCRCQPLGLN